MDQKRISIRDVAKLAGSSITTVSRVLSGSSYPVSEERRSLILAAIRDLNYSPNTAAQMMKKKFSNLIGLIARDIADPYFGEIAKGVTEKAMKLGFLCFICNTGRVPENELEYLELLWRHKVRGIVLAGGGMGTPAHREKIAGILQRGRQYGQRLVGLAPQATDMPVVTVDYAATVRMLADYLWDRGHRRIALVSGAQAVLTSRDHLRGYIAALEARGAARDDGLVVFGDFTERAGYEGAERLCRPGPPPEAVVCGSDTIAMGVVHYLTSRGLRVPGDVSVTGIGDIPQSLYITPPLTTVRIPRYEMGCRAVEMIARGDDGFFGEDVIFRPKLVERGSVRDRR